VSRLLSIPRNWELIKSFKEWCKCKGWRSDEEEDWIRLGHEFHDFVWVKNVQPSTFRRVMQNPKCTIHDGLSYRVVNASYVAWLFQELPSGIVVQALIDDPKLCARTALYDFSQVYQEAPTCLKLNATKSQVFDEFERFLSENWGVAVKASNKG
jgi:hypothetical protein